VKKLLYLLGGNTLSSFAIACVLNSGLGAFSCTAGNSGIASFMGISLGLASFITETLMLLYATYRNEGVGWTAIINTTYGSLMIDVFHKLLPICPWLSLGGLLLPIAWSYMGRAGWGDTGTNLAMVALMKQTGKSLRFCRCCIDITFLMFALLWASHTVSLFTLFLTFATGPIVQFVYGKIHYNPELIKHHYILAKRCS
jgi:uncharacterized membrane protein YczE